MNELATKYSPRDVEEKWYAYWMDHGLFHSEPDAREPYCIVIPPHNDAGQGGSRKNSLFRTPVLNLR